jgi:RNA polymerase-binding transcription factor DksA
MRKEICMLEALEMEEREKANARRALVSERDLLVRYEDLDGYEAAHLQRVSAALERLDEGTWGWCQVCARRIESWRLRTIPETTRCAHCGAR